MLTPLNACTETILPGIALFGLLSLYDSSRVISLLLHLLAELFLGELILVLYYNYSLGVVKCVGAYDNLPGATFLESYDLILVK